MKNFFKMFSVFTCLVLLQCDSETPSEPQRSQDTLNIENNPAITILDLGSAMDQNSENIVSILGVKNGNILGFNMKGEIIVNEVITQSKKLSLKTKIDTKGNGRIIYKNDLLIINDTGLVKVYRVSDFLNPEFITKFPVNGEIQAIDYYANTVFLSIRSDSMHAFRIGEEVLESNIWTLAVNISNPLNIQIDTAGGVSFQKPFAFPAGLLSFKNDQIYCWKYPLSNRWQDTLIELPFPAYHLCDNNESIIAAVSKNGTYLLDVSTFGTVNVISEIDDKQMYIRFKNNCIVSGDIHLKGYIKDGNQYITRFYQETRTSGTVSIQFDSEKPVLYWIYEKDLRRILQVFDISKYL